MSELIRAILDGDTNKVRFLTKTRPDLLHENSVIGTTPLRLAFDKGRVDIQVTLIRAGAPGSNETQNFSMILLNYIGELSYDLACAGWLDDIEYSLWQTAILKEPLSEDTYNLETLADETKHDLEFLVKYSGGWAAYLDNGPSYVSQEEWLKMYSERR